MRAGFSTEYFCYEYFSYSAKYVDELYDVLEECSKMVKYYLETSVGFSDEIKSDINKLSMRIDNLYLDFNMAYVLMAGIINEAKKEFMLSKKLKADKKDADAVSKRIEKMGIDLKGVIEDTRVYMNKVHNSKAA